eukprot:515407-Amphidinium_carterae.1
MRSGSELALFNMIVRINTTPVKSQHLEPLSQNTIAAMLLGRPILITLCIVLPITSSERVLFLQIASRAAKFKSKRQAYQDGCSRPSK